VLSVVCLTRVVPAAAQQAVPDHLKCYKVKDPAPKARYTADLTGLAPEPGCTIKVPGTMLCVETTKRNVQPTPPGGGTSGTPAGNFLCYKLKCPKATVPPVMVNDQFGARMVTPSVSKLVCAPVPPPPTTTSTTTTTTSSCPPATAFYCGTTNCGGGTNACGGFNTALCPSGMTCTTVGTTCACTGAAIPCGDPRLGGLTCNFCQWGTCPPGMTCGGVPRNGGCGFDCACH